MAFCIPLGRGDSNCAKANALLFGLNWCIQNGHPKIIGETDSLLLQNCIQGNWQSPWKIEDTISKIKFLLDTHHIHTTHYMREANKVADKLASLSHKSENNCIYTNYSSLPRQIIGLLNIDKWQIPSFRVRRRNHGAITFDPP
ncbi:hypothetical protein KY289_002062 [Solanum tuberosum]|nr:hypothetical protein KY289_002062 [Solanum tuberosum]